MQDTFQRAVSLPVNNNQVVAVVPPVEVRQEALNEFIRDNSHVMSQKSTFI